MVRRWTRYTIWSVGESDDYRRAKASLHVAVGDGRYCGCRIPSWAVFRAWVSLGCPLSTAFCTTPEGAVLAGAGCIARATCAALFPPDVRATARAVSAADALLASASAYGIGGSALGRARSRVWTALALGADRCLTPPPPSSPGRSQMLGALKDARALLGRPAARSGNGLKYVHGSRGVTYADIVLADALCVSCVIDAEELGDYPDLVVWGRAVRAAHFGSR